MKQDFLTEDQIDAMNRMFNGCILNGKVGSGKTRTSLAYYFKQQGGDILNNTKMHDNPQDLYIITTAKNRDDLNWEREMIPFQMSTEAEHNHYNNKIVVDSWQNIQKYINIENSFFIFDEQRVTGKGAWVKAFWKITKKNNWILLSGTPGDCWQDYFPVFKANGFYQTQTEFYAEHFVWSPYTKYPKVLRYLNEGRLIRLRDKLLINMVDKRETVPHHEDVYCDYDIQVYKDVVRKRWNYTDNKPIESASEYCYQLRKVINSSPDRQLKLLEILEKHNRAIIFYNFDYELEILIDTFKDSEYMYAQWNGHAHQPLPTGDKWVYLVQYSAGCEAWNCITTDTIIFFTQNYSYKILEQACGRINRFDSPFKDLYYYHLKSRSGIDLAISQALARKKKFNEGQYVYKCKLFNPIKKI